MVSVIAVSYTHLDVYKRQPVILGKRLMHWNHQYILLISQSHLCCPGRTSCIRIKKEPFVWLLCASIRSYLSRMISVSYTHLDVYKRQVIVSVGKIGGVHEGVHVFAVRDSDRDKSHCFFSFRFVSSRSVFLFVSFLSRVPQV